MKKIIVVLCAIAACSVVAPSCTRDCGPYGHEYGRGDGLRVLWDRHDCPDYHPASVYPREFFGLSEFRQYRDDLYGNRRDWRDEDYGNFRGRDCYDCGGARSGNSLARDRAYRTGGRDPEGAVSERYSPPPPAQPDLEYDE